MRSMFDVRKFHPGLECWKVPGSVEFIFCGVAQAIDKSHSDG